MPLTAKAAFKDYLLNSSFHGLRFIADDKLHWTERVFWLVCVLLSWYGSFLLVAASWDAFQNNAISFVVETTYKDWDTNFPAIAVCENLYKENVYTAADTIWPPDHDVNLEGVLEELAYFRGLSPYTLQTCHIENPDPLCPLNNFSYYSELVRSPCKQLLRNCKYNGRPFDCCTHFEPIDTDIGRCYVINSIQTKKNQKKQKEPLPMISNRKNGLGVLSMNPLIPVTVYTLGDEEVPTLTTLQSDFFAVENGNKYRRHISVKNIENDPYTRETTMAQRNCHYEDENWLDVYPYYSRSACTVQCRKDAQRSLCNCSDHFMPNTKEKDKCTMVGLVCLHQHYSDLSVLRPPWARRSGLVCDCPPSCNEDEISVIKDDKSSPRDDKTASLVEIEIEYLPSERFKRNVVRSRLDLVVSTGGTTGLFVGASLLSFVELIYYLTIRYYGTVYNERAARQQLVSEPGNTSHNVPVINYSSETKKEVVVDIKRTREELHQLKK